MNTMKLRILMVALVRLGLAGCAGPNGPGPSPEPEPPPVECDCDLEEIEEACVEECQDPPNYGAPCDEQMDCTEGLRCIVDFEVDPYNGICDTF